MEKMEHEKWRKCLLKMEKRIYKQKLKAAWSGGWDVYLDVVNGELDVLGLCATSRSWFAIWRLRGRHWNRNLRDERTWKHAECDNCESERRAEERKSWHDTLEESLRGLPGRRRPSDEKPDPLSCTHRVENHNKVHLATNLIYTQIFSIFSRRKTHPLAMRKTTRQGAGFVRTIPERYQYDLGGRRRVNHPGLIEREVSSLWREEEEKVEKRSA